MKTKSGFEFEVNEKLKNDFRFVLALADINSNDADRQLGAAAKLASIALGEDGAKRLYEFVSEEDGTIPTDRVMGEITEIIKASGEKDAEVKN